MSAIAPDRTSPMAAVLAAGVKHWTTRNRMAMPAETGTSPVEPPVWLRDESHRFAISFHRELRGKRMTTSVLDGIPGLGDTRKKRLVRELGGVGAVKKAPLEQLQALSWLPDAVAQAVHDKVHKPG